MRIVLVTGDRHWKDEALVFRHVLVWAQKWEKEDWCVMHGDALGADAAARSACHQLRVPQLIVPAQWNKHNKAAGPIRNRWMLRMLKSAEIPMVIAYHDNLSQSRGTRDMVELCRESGIFVLHYYHGEDGTEKVTGLSGYVSKV